MSVERSAETTGSRSAVEAPGVQPAPLPGLVVRGCAGGALMGLANLVPGISGGTMLLAAGIYPRFVAAVAEVSTLRFRLHSLVTLGAVAVSALLAVAMLAGVIKDLVVLHRWLAYSLFIGLTLGGVPVIWRMIGKRGAGVWVGFTAGVVAMSALALAQQPGSEGGGTAESTTLLLIVAGVAAASAMVLPGISGSYLLLVLGQYVPLLVAVDAVRSAAGEGSFSAAVEPSLRILLPFGVGILAGIILVSNLVGMLLERRRDATLGVLLGLLVGAVVGLWPFRRPLEPVVGDSWDGEILTEAMLSAIPVESWPTEVFSPSGGQLASALCLMLLGFAITTLISWLGRALEKRPRRRTPELEVS